MDMSLHYTQNGCTYKLFGINPYAQACFDLYGYAHRHICGHMEAWR